ncbi:type II toxin-antitoxin system VapC family toxin [Aetokthonos hydrillicola Thurmond2011]|jgi:tRNA(fMet)-specific endonuclease VapC|uniref:Ribonuclease VapC n=1 Tax=Aetokthonos hydrillicola Thurmond2011 TaxID=2712845 RepID=A0AAP5IC79_9CYAN|nr:type II toxin-antitoxin system VapC family toxin [Aetokthonos hydrillicola]MBO3457361.1 type II toxin-antitoxin system VapC family toxin [Aetokthonos hydrillicola CCALA 1050]MBW4583963.1 type II toxin-antitoxin system VapC family toxin [Aetokthonos hydrillicola CCALA 1050]MDR9898841.1 type II toxin-antitoxin system VapC family toxin [Aetokthonos hydrillicola Thurmond2011]
MSGRYLLDTNIIIAIFANDKEVNNQLGNANEIFIPSVAIAELFYGARKSGRSQNNIERIEEFIARNTVIGCDVETARQYGKVKNGLRLKGRPLPENDIWIASIAIQYNLILVTRDAHFQEVENLQTEAW